MSNESRLQALSSEADRYSAIAEQSANRIHVTLSVGLAALSGNLAAAFLAKNAFVLGFAPLVAEIVIIIALFGSLESLYASAYHAYAEHLIRRLEPEGTHSIPLYGRGERQQKQMSQLGVWMWATVIITFALLAAADFVGAFLLAHEKSWTSHGLVGITTWAIGACLAIVVLIAGIMIYRFGRAWRELKLFEEEHLPTDHGAKNKNIGLA